MEELLEQNGKDGRSPDTPLGKYIEYWLNTYKLNKVEITTYERLVSVYEHQIKEQLGDVRLKDLRTDMIQRLIDSYSDPKRYGDLKLAYSGLKRLKHLLNASLGTAVEEGLIDKNPCEMVILPKIQYISKATGKQFVLSDDQIVEFKKACLSKYKKTGEYKSRDGLVLLIVLGLGLRVSEVLALDWEDVDFEKQIIYIRKTFQTSKNKGNIIKEGAKTPASVRTLPMNEGVMNCLYELRAYDKRNGIVSNAVCCTGVGTRHIPRNFRRSLDRIISWTIITDTVTLHTLRHSFGSCMLRHGVNIEVVRKLMGHSDITDSYDKYIYVSQEQEAEAMKKVHIV